MEFIVTRASDVWEPEEKRMTFTSLEELKEFALKEKHRLVIDFSDIDCFGDPKEMEIVIYDDYIE